MDRRRFLEALAGLTAGLTITPRTGEARPGTRRDRLGDVLPQRMLGRTGEAVTMLGVGGWHLGRMSDRDAQATIETALEGGVRFFDSAESYQNGGSERTLGRFLTPRYRDVAFLMTKTTATDADTARAHLEGSLRRLRTDYLDLWQVHSITSPDDVDRRIENGVLDVVQEEKERGRVRHVGFTGHARPSAHLRMLERTDVFETAQMPVNAADPSYNSFIDQVVPVLVEREVGVIAMKTLSNGGFFGGTSHGQHGDNPRVVPDRISVREALHFVWSLPVSVVVSGPDDPAMLQEKIDLARAFEPLDEAARREIVARVAPLAGGTVEFYKRA